MQTYNTNKEKENKQCTNKRQNNTQ